MKYIKTIGLVIAIMSSAIYSFAQTDSVAEQSIFDVIAYQDVVEVNLALNMQDVFGSRKDKGKHAAVFSFTDKNGELQSWNIKVAQRGRFRRSRCENMPPLKLNFKKKELEAGNLTKFDDMKLVTHCVDNAREAKQLIVKEYLAYKLYNQITEESFRAQLVKINYIDNTSGRKEKQYGIIIEDTAQLRDRLNVKKLKVLYNQPKENFNEENAKMVSLFNYMIGNLDWSIPKLHNIKVFDNRDGTNVIIPYDFDFSGLVSASYAVIDRDLGVSNQRQRLFLGFRDDVQHLEETIQLFSSRKEAILQTIEDCPLLSSKSRKDSLRYIKSFYNNLEEIRLPKGQPVLLTGSE